MIIDSKIMYCPITITLETVVEKEVLLRIAELARETKAYRTEEEYKAIVNLLLRMK